MLQCAMACDAHEDTVEDLPVSILLPLIHGRTVEEEPEISPVVCP